MFRESDGATDGCLNIHEQSSNKQTGNLAANRKSGKLLSGECRSLVTNPADPGKHQKHAVLEPLTKVTGESEKHILFYFISIKASTKSCLADLLNNWFEMPGLQIHC